MNHQIVRYRLTWFGAVVAALAGSANAADKEGIKLPEPQPKYLMQLVEPETIYDVPSTRGEEGANIGGMHLGLNVRYLTDYVFRGVDQSERLAAFDTAGGGPILEGVGAEDAPNLQFDAMLRFDLGRAPHPFAGVFANIYNDDPGSEFQEIRPYFGVEWAAKPLKIAAGNTTYIYVEREDLNTAEVWMRITLDDSVIWRTEKPPLAPYVLGAYDYDLYDGLYVEFGVEHKWEIDDLNLTLTGVASVAYVSDHSFFTDPGADDLSDSGFQHYQLGLIGAYSLNELFNTPPRYGRWSLTGYLYYTDGIDDDLLSDTQLWGGVGIQFDY